ncbi:UDP-glycosyltransferase 84B2-like [Silene latifolia]|uniref:UDP-glycosyltransferase 84B2-like n=1 Tax=Silene latifolia TaxID=37657 RepID=UPI003D788ADF
MSSSIETHILMVSLFYQGHINPMLRFAKLLNSKGIHVTLATTEHARNRMQNGSWQSDNLIDYEYFGDGLEMDVNRDKNLDILLGEYLPRDGAKNLSSLIDFLQGKGKKFSCIIGNCFVPWVASVSKTYNIPCGMLWVQSCATYTISYHYFKNSPNFPSLSDPNNIVEIQGLPLLKVGDLPTYVLPSTPPHFRNVVKSTINTLDQFDWIFGSSFQEIEETFVNCMANYKPISLIGPLVPPTMFEKQEHEKDDNELCMNWLDKQTPSSVIYIALGSISVLSQGETEAIASVLEKDTQRHFLWVRKEAENGWGRKMGELPNEFSEKTKDRGLIVPWCCQEKVLMHPSINCFLTHCGWNSTLEAITGGIPVIAYPDWTDQVTNAKLLVDVFKVGVRMRKCDKNGELEKKEVERCIFEVTQGPNALYMKNQAIMWKKAAKDAIFPNGSSYKIIDNFINEIKGNVA